MAYIFGPWRAALWLAVATLTTSPAHAAPGYEVQPWPARKPIPALVAKDLNGRLWRLSDLRGKAVLINFWASWCPPCRAEMPTLQVLAQYYGSDDLIVLAVNFKEAATTVQRFVQQTDLSLPMLLDPQGAMAHQWGIDVFPSTVLIGADARVRSIVRGEMDWTGAQASRLLGPLLAPAGKAQTQQR